VLFPVAETVVDEWVDAPAEVLPTPWF
jgi:hypothetical protein